MKTRDRILHTSLALFNEEGEATTTTIDIANELNISPGNLYYHFTAKDQIIAALFQQYEQAMQHTLTAPLERPLSSHHTPTHKQQERSSLQMHKPFWQHAGTALRSKKDLNS